MSSGPVWVFSFGEVFLSFRWIFLLLFSVDRSFGFLGLGFFFYRILPNSSPASPHEHLLPQKPQKMHSGKTDTWMHPFLSRSQHDSPQNKNQCLCCRNRLTSGHNNPCWGKFAPPWLGHFKHPQRIIPRNASRAFYSLQNIFKAAQNCF